MATLSIVFKGDDQVSAASKQVAQDISGVGKAADEAAPKGSGFFGGMMQAASGFLAADLIGNLAGQFKDFLGDGLAAARDTQQLMAQTETIIKNTGGAAGVSADEVAQLASSLSDAAGQSLFGDDAVQGAENVLLKYKELKVPLADVTKLSVDMAQTLGTAPADAAKTLGLALQNPFEASAKLAKQGIILTDQQNATLQAFKKSGDAAGAQAFLMEQLNSTYAGSAKAAADAAGGTVQFKARMGEVAENLATAFLPVMDQLGQVLVTTVAPAIEAVAGWIGDNLPSAIAAVSAVIGPLIASFQQTGGAGLDLGSTITDLAAIWAALQPVVLNAVGAIRDLVLSVFGVIQEFITAHGEEIAATMEDTWTRIMAIIKVGIELYNAIVPPVLRVIAGFIKAHGAEIQAILKTTWDSIKAVIDIALSLIEGIIKTATAVFKGDWQGAWDAIKEMSGRIVTDLWTIIKGGLDNVVTVFAGTWTKIKDGVGQFVTVTIPTLGSSIIDGLISAVANGSSALASAIWQMVKDAVASAIGLLGGGGGGGDSGQGLRASGSPRLSGGQAIGSSSTSTSMRANVTINAAPEQNVHQVARATVNLMNRQMKQRRG